METSGDKAHRFGRVPEQLSAGIIGRCHRIEMIAVCLGIGAGAPSLITSGLNLTRCRDARGDLRRSFGWR